jgi:hypothetical protein
MAWDLLSSKGLVSPRKSLASARESLVWSLAQPEERRGEFRLFSPTMGARMSPLGERLLNISRSGLAVGVKKCTFARGEHYRVTLADGSNQADLEGRVCWTRSTWPRESTASDAGGYFQAAGLAIAEPLTRDQAKRWRMLRESVQEGVDALEVTIAPVR